MKSLISLLGGAMASALLATAATAHMGPGVDARIVHASPITVSQAATARSAPGRLLAAPVPGPVA